MDLLQQKLLAFWQNKRLFAIVIGGFLLLLIVFIYFSFSQGTSISIPTKQISSSPDVYFGTYKNNASFPTLPQSVHVYTLKNNFTPHEITVFAAQFGIHSVKQPAGTNNTNYNAVDIPTKSLFSFDASAGSFSYQSKGTLQPNGYQPGQSANSEALALLQQIGLADKTIACDITYQRRASPGIIFVECHRDWKKAGLPIFSFDGLLNVPQTTPLSSVQLGKVDAVNFPDDSDIINVSGVVGYIPNGKARPSEFNTVTVGIRSDGTISSIDSTLRWIVNTETLPSATNVFTPQQAIKQFINHNALLSLTTPLGNGAVDLQKAYQDNKAIAKEATITDYVLSYIEKTPHEEQHYLVPMYTIRGTATLISGYQVSFIQTLPVLQDGKSFLSYAAMRKNTRAKSTIKDTENIASFLPQAYADNKQLQLGTFNPSGALTSTPIQLSSSSTPAPTESMTQCFDYSSLQFANSSTNRLFLHGITHLDQATFTIPGSGTLKLAYNLAVALGAAGGFASDMVFYESSSFPVGHSQATDDFFGLVANQYTINVARHLVTDQAGSVNASSTIADVKNVFAAINGGQCPLLLPRSNSAPAYNCSANNSGGIRGSLDTARMNNVADITAQQVLDAVKANTITTLANQQDILPAGLAGNNHVFITVDFPSLWGKNPVLAPLATCYLTGGVTLIEGASPSLFIYSPVKQTVSITLPSFTTYTDPSTDSGNIWKLIANPDGSLQDLNGKIYPYLYYEYAKNFVSFSQPYLGFVIPYNQWENTVRNNIAKKLQLTAKETDRLVVEVQNTLYGKTKSPYLILSLPSQEEINQKLPLAIFPKPDSLYRIQILVTPTNKNLLLPKPVLTPLVRKSFTMIEVGARLEK